MCLKDWNSSLLTWINVIVLRLRLWRTCWKIEQMEDQEDNICEGVNTDAFYCVIDSRKMKRSDKAHCLNAHFVLLKECFKPVLLECCNFRQFCIIKVIVWARLPYWLTRNKNNSIAWNSRDFTTFQRYFLFIHKRKG